MATKLSEAANIDNIRFQEQAAAPDTPASGYGRVWVTDDGTAHYKNDAGTDVSLVVSAEIYLPAREGIPAVTAGSAALAQSETTTNDVNYQSLDFDQTTQEHAHFHLMMPDDWDAGTITFKAIWTAASGTGTVIFGLQGISFANDDALDTAFGTAVTVTDTLLATGDLHVTPTSTAITIGGTPTTGEFVVLRVYRDIADTLNADAKLIGIKLYYTRL